MFFVVEITGEIVRVGAGGGIRARDFWDRASGPFSLQIMSLAP
jgi:hypothetical protein